ncbi:hypothetical protein [uncultured Schumannella sp.]|jgi:hypothetical protein|uniref:hypothetical protein n=1 Tax=uncultured Schumannella sp. TaxID=1195956 RepID=UPI0025E186D4|nr:hypothetical protein [uncultured Schumannella sp.]
MTTQPITVFAPVVLRTSGVRRPGLRRLAVRLGVALVSWGRRDVRPATRDQILARRAAELQLEATRRQGLFLAADHGPR